jgi:hypothetical protein
MLGAMAFLPACGGGAGATSGIEAEAFAEREVLERFSPSGRACRATLVGMDEELAQCETAGTRLYRITNDVDAEMVAETLEVDVVSDRAEALVRVSPATEGRGLAEVVEVKLTILARGAGWAVEDIRYTKATVDDLNARLKAMRARKAMEAFRLRTGDYDWADDDALEEIAPELAVGPRLRVNAMVGAYELEVLSESGTKFRLAQPQLGAPLYTCRPAGAGGCPDSGTWWVAGSGTG